MWTTTERPRVRMNGKDNSLGNGNGNDTVQVSRLGNPLVNEVVVPAGLKDTFNSISPDKDAGIQAVVDRVTNPEVPKLIEAIYEILAPPAPRNDLVEIFLTGITTKANGPTKADLNSQLNNADVDPKKFRPSELLRLNMSTPIAQAPNRLGVLAGDLQGFPNGRRLSDDAVDIALQAVEVRPRPASWSTRWPPGTRSTPTTTRSTARSRTSPCPTPPAVCPTATRLPARRRRPLPPRHKG